VPHIRTRRASLRALSIRGAIAFAAALGLALAAPVAAMADTVTWSGTLETGDPTWSRPSCIGSGGNTEWWDAQPFTVSADGVYSFEMTSSAGVAPDGYFLAYLQTFDPAAPNTGCIAADDDSGIGINPALSATLTAGVTYWLLTTQCCNGVTAGEEMSYTNAITGPGSVTLFSSAVIVEPTTLTTSEDGTAATFTVRLGAPTIAGADVVVPLVSTDPGEGTVPASVTIPGAQWATGVAVTVTPVADGVADGDTTFSISTGEPASADLYYDALTADDVADVTVVNTDIDVAAQPAATLPDTGADSNALLAVAGLTVALGAALVVHAGRRRSRA